MRVIRIHELEAIGEIGLGILWSPQSSSHMGTSFVRLGVWWAMQDLNLRPSLCKRDALAN